MIEQTPEKDIKQKQNNHNDEEIEIDLIGILRKIIGIRKTIYKAAGIGLVVLLPVDFCLYRKLLPDFYKEHRQSHPALKDIPSPVRKYSVRFLQLQTRCLRSQNP